MIGYLRRDELFDSAQLSGLTGGAANSAKPRSVDKRRRLLPFLMLLVSSVFSASLCFAGISFAGDGTAEGENEPGNLMILGGGKVAPEARDRFFQLAGGKAARIVLIPTGSEEVHRPEFMERFLAPWKQYAPESLVILHTEDRRTADKLEFVRPLQQATGVWIGGGIQTRLTGRYLHTRVEDELRALRSRGGILAGTSAGAAIMTRAMIADGMKRPVMAEGFDFFRGAIVDQHFSQRFRMPRLSTAVRMNPHRFGVGIDEETGLLVSGDKGTVIGNGHVRFMVTPQSGTSASPSLLVRDYSSGEEVALRFWRDTAGNALLEEEEAKPLSRKVLIAESHLVPSLSYSLLHEYEQVDSRR